jgi:integration host factor subunit beta
MGHNEDAAKRRHLVLGEGCCSQASVGPSSAHLRLVARQAAKEGCLIRPAILDTFRPEGSTVIKSELIDRISTQNPHLYRQDAEKIVNTVFSEITAAMARGDRVELRGFGVFFARFREGRTGRNPRTGALVSVESKAIPFFRSGKEMKLLLNSYAHGSDTDTGRDTTS